MNYCIEHNEKAYTKKQFKKVNICNHAGTYQSIEDGKIRVYCFKVLDGNPQCPKEVNHESVPNQQEPSNVLLVKA